MSSPVDFARVLIVDDLVAIHDDFRKILAPSDAAASLRQTAAALFGGAKPAAPLTQFDVATAQQGEEALRLVKAALAADQPFALAFVDMRMPPGWDGVETIRHFWQADPELQVVLCTAYSDYSWSETVSALGHTDQLIILKKPFESTEVLQLAHALTRKWRLAREHRVRLADLDELVRQRTRELALAEERFERAFAASPLPQLVLALDTLEILETNPALETSLGGGPTGISPGGRLIEGLDPAAWAAMLRQLHAGQPVDDQPLTFTSREHAREFRCAARALQIGGRPCAICVLRDVTDQLALEQQFLQAQKMEAVGQLAAGVAHDFNNLLTIILSYSGLILDHARLVGDDRANLEQVRAAAERAAALTRQLLVFTRRQITKAAPVDVAATVANLRKLLSRLVPERISVQIQCAPNLPRLVADEANLEHIIMNLVVNARDAIARDGRITIAVDCVQLDAQAARRHPDARPGRFIRLSVADTGSGIAPEHLPRIFEPFFTTKEVGKGTGLGLPTVYGIVRQHEGWIEVASKPGAGATFQLFLPLTDDAAERSAPLPAAPSGVTDVQGRGEHILVVEDDRAVRFMARRLIEHANYRVTEAADGPAALAAWQSGQGQFDLLLTDIVMPNGYSGVELAQRLRRESPRLKVILATGYSNELLRGTLAGVEDATILLKPYSARNFLATIRAALDAHPAAAG